MFFISMFNIFVYMQLYIFVYIGNYVIYYLYLYSIIDSFISLVILCLLCLHIIFRLLTPYLTLSPTFGNCLRTSLKNIIIHNMFLTIVFSFI